jgi:hypothetical protein
VERHGSILRISKLLTRDPEISALAFACHRSCWRQRMACDSFKTAPQHNFPLQPPAETVLKRSLLHTYGGTFS